MLEHRFREHLAADSAATTSTNPVAFVLCPMPAGYSPTQLACVAEVYRLAREMTTAQLEARRFDRAFPPAFSLN